MVEKYTFLFICLFVRPEAKVPRLMGGGYDRPRGQFQRGRFGYRGGNDNFGPRWSGGRPSLLSGSAANSFGSMSGFGSGRGMRQFGANQGPRQLGFDTNGRGFGGNWRSGRARGSFGGGNWSGNMGSESDSGMFGGGFGSMNTGSFSFDQSAGDVGAQFGSMAGQGYGDTTGQYGQ